MNPIRSLAILAAGLALASSALANGASRRIFVEVAASHRAQALKSIKQFGSLVAVDSKRGEYALDLKSGVNAHSTLLALRNDRRISLAWSDSEPVGKSARMGSVAEVTAAFNKIKPTREDALEELENAMHGKRDADEGRGENGADFLGGYLYFLSRRAYPYDRMDWSAYGPAIDRMNSMPTFQPGGTTTTGRKPSAISSGGASTQKWQFIGPKNLTFPYEWGFGLGPGSGRVNAAAYDTTAAGTWYVGGAEGGLWKTTNSGLTWTPLGDTWQYMCVSSIAIDPTNSKTIYVGTGDFPGWQSFSEGVMKSTDGGATWRVLGQAQFGGSCVSSVLVDPTNSADITITTGDGGYNVEQPGYVWRSTNGGTSWTPAIAVTAEWSDGSISLSDGGTRHYYVAGYSGNTSYLERSDNQGASWTQLTPPTGLSTGAYQIKASAVDPKTVYFFAPNSQKVYKSTDTGGSWTDISGNLPSIGDWGQAYYDYYLTVVNNGGSDDLFAGLIDVFELPTSSGSWVSVIKAYTGNDLTHVDQHCLTVNPNNPNDILVGNDGGIYHGTRTNGVWAFNSVNKTMGVTQFYDGTWSPTDPNIMLGGAQDNGTPLTTGDTSNWGVVIGGDGFFVAMNPVNTKIQYGTVYYDSVVETQDGWKTSFGMSPPVGQGEPTPFVSIIQQDPVNTNYLYCTSNYLYRWDNSVQSWTSHLGGTALSNGSVIHCISVAPSNGNVIYTGSDDGRIFVSRDGGNSFTNINSGSLPNRSISSISVDRKNANSIVVGVSGTGTAHLFQCTNTTAGLPTYASVSGAGNTGLPDISLNCMDRDQANPATTWYVGTDIGVFATSNGGKTWTNATIPLGLPSCQVTAIQTTKYQTLNVSTYGRGMWKIAISAIGGASQPPNSVKPIDGVFVPSTPIPVNNFVQQLASDDHVIVTMSSGHNVAVQAQAATMEADFNFGAGHSLGGASFSITAATNAPTTLQLFLFNNSTGRFDVIATYPAAQILTNNVITVSVPNPGVYMNAAGLVKADFRALSPDRNGSPFQMTMDSFTISASVN